MSSTVPSYFTSNNSWNQEDFSRQHPGLDYWKELQKLATSSNQRLCRHAKAVLGRKKRSTRRCSPQSSEKPEEETVLNPSSPLNNSIELNNSVVSNLIFNGVIGGNQSSLDQSAPQQITRKRPLSSTNIDTQPPAKTSRRLYDVSLEPSGTSLRERLSKLDKSDRAFTLFEDDGILLITDDSVIAAITKEDQNFLNEKIQPLPAVSPYFTSAIEACLPRLNDTKFWPVPPTQNTPEDEDEWHFVSIAFLHMTKHLPVLLSRSISHREVWSDVNIWSVTLDFGCLSSSSITIDRKEISSGNPKHNVRHDGIVREVAAPKATVGYIEVKPTRKYDYDDDWQKVVTSVAAKLREYQNPELAVTGIVCSATSMTVIRGVWLKNGVVVIKEITEHLTLKTIPQLVELSWKVKLGFEQSYSQIVKRQSREISNF